MKKAFVFDIEKINSIILSHVNVCIEVDADGWFYSVAEEYAGFNNEECFAILSKKLNAEVEDIIVDTTNDKVAVICK